MLEIFSLILIKTFNLILLISGWKELCDFFIYIFLGTFQYYLIFQLSDNILYKINKEI